jgi:hypothetical protein
VLASQQANLAHGVLPFTRHDPIKTQPWLRHVVAALVLAVAIGFAATRPATIRPVWLAAVAAGPIWLLGMRNLAAFHEYTAIYLFPLCLVFFAAILVRFPKLPALGAALGSAWLLAACTSASNRTILQSAGTSRADTRDLAAIERALAPGDAVATDKQILRGVPYALGFYLPDHDVVVEGPASLVISRRRRFEGENLTPKNAGIFLFRPDGAYFAHSSLARHHRGSKAAHKVAMRHETGRKRSKR